MNPVQLAEILGMHLKWIRGEPDGKRADLYRANLIGADLTVADLYGADLTVADLYGADLYGADLYGADLRGANLRRADLRRADLHRANLTGADLTGANLRNADMRGANLRNANLYGANLTGANLHSANLRGANLGELKIVQIGPIGSRGDYLVVCWGKDHEGNPVDRIDTGCFHKTLAEFEQAVEREHGTDVHGSNYRAAIALIRTLQSLPENGSD